jgi:hypothetical protein
MLCHLIYSAVFLSPMVCLLNSEVLFFVKDVGLLCVHEKCACISNNEFLLFSVNVAEFMQVMMYYSQI